MREFKTIEEVKNCVELRKAGRYHWERVKVNGEEMIACTTDQQYEDIIWSGIYEMLEQLSDKYDLVIDSMNMASEVRDIVLEKLEEEHVKFVDVFDEY